MQFIVHGYDGTDAEASNRRLAAREAHLKEAREWKDKKRWLFAAALLDEDGKMVGSVIVCDFPSEEALQAEWLQKEPYVTGNVWQKVEIRRAQIAPMFAAG